MSTFRHKSAHVRRTGDRYFTIDAPWIVPALLRHITLRGEVMEPHAGRGHLVFALQQAGYQVWPTDITQHAASLIGRIPTLVDFLGINLPPIGVHSIVMNPPYADLDRHVQHAVNLMEPANQRGIVCLLARSTWSHAKVRRALVHDHPAYHAKIELLKRPRWIEGSTGSPSHDYAWFVWDWQRDPDQPPALYGAGPQVGVV